MNWEQLLSLRRQGDTSKRYALNKTTPDWVLKWIDRIIFSAAFRSLQTQVIHYQNTDFVHQTDAV
jgi:dGTPase